MRIRAMKKQSQNKPNSKPIKANFRQEMPKMPYLPACVWRPRGRSVSMTGLGYTVLANTQKRLASVCSLLSEVCSLLSVECIPRQEKYAWAHTIRIWDTTIGSNGNLHRYDFRGRIGLNMPIGVSCPQLDFRKVVRSALAGPIG